MGRRKNTFTKAIHHLKSKQIDEKLELLNEIPTNNTANIYVNVPDYFVQDPDETVLAGEVDFTQDDPASNGRDTTGLFAADGTILTIEPPGDTTYILGPMASMWYAWGNFSTIGYIRQSDRRMVDLGRITGRLINWDGSTGFTSYGQLTLAQAVWFRDTPKLNGADNDTPNYRAFYPGPPSNAPDQYGRYYCVITGTPKPTTRTPPPRRVPPVMGGFDKNLPPGSALPKLGLLNIGTLGQLGARLLRSFTDSSRFAGDFMFKGLPKGVNYLPNFTGAAQKGLAANLTGGKKWADVFGNFGKALAGKNYATQYFTPSLNKALDYAKAGGTVVVMPRTPSVQGFKNWFGGSVSRGFGKGDIEKLVRTSDTIKSFNQGTTKIFNLADPNSMVELQKLATQGAKTNTMLGKLGRAVPFVGAGAAIADVGMRLSKGDYAGAVLGGISAVPGPIGWVGLGAQVLYDTTAPQGLKNYLNKDVPKFYGGLSNSTQIKGNFLIEQMESEYLNSIRQSLIELGSPKDKKEYAAQQGTLLSLMDVNPELVSIITISAAGEEFSPEQKQWIENNLIPMIEIFSALRENQKDIKIQESILLPESHQRILKDLKKPYQLPEEKKEKIKHRPRVIGSESRTINPDLMKKAEVPTSFKPMEEKLWGKYEKEQNARASQERKNEVLDHLGGSDHFWEYMTETSKQKSKDIMYGNFSDNKKFSVVRKEQLKGDNLLFIVDENGNKENILQSELSIKIADEMNRELFQQYFKEQETLQADKDPLFKKVKDKLKPIIDYSDKPSKLGYPDQPPPESVDGWHPEYGQRDAYYNKLDSQSANSMPTTGNSNIDAKVQRAKKIKKIIGKKA